MTSNPRTWKRFEGTLGGWNASLVCAVERRRVESNALYTSLLVSHVYDLYSFLVGASRELDIHPLLFFVVAWRE